MMLIVICVLLVQAYWTYNMAAFLVDELRTLDVLINILYNIEFSLSLYQFMHEQCNNVVYNNI